MNNQHLIDAMKEAVRASEGDRAEALQNEIDASEEVGNEVTFVPASRQAQQLLCGVLQCMVIHRLPYNVIRSGKIAEYTGYLVREAHRNNSFGHNQIEKEDNYLVQFPGRPEEEYTYRAFCGSLRELLQSELRKTFEGDL